MFKNLKAEMTRRDMTYKDLAENLRVSYSTVSNWMNEKTEIPASCVVKLAKFFQCTTDYLLDLKDQPI